MPRRPKSRQCPRCGHVHPGHHDKACKVCGTGLIKHRWRMTKGRLARVHMLAERKGLIRGEDDELYRLRLQAAGVTSSKEFKQPQYREFVKDMEALPDA